MPGPQPHQPLAAVEQPGHAHPFISDLLATAVVPSPPPRRPVEVTRNGLLARVTNFHGRVVLFSAPAGYGKSMMAAQWCRSDQRPVIWLAADQLDDDPIALGVRLLLALHAVAPLDGDAIEALAGSPLRMNRLLLPTITQAIAARQPLVIAIDDAHHLRSHQTVVLLRSLIDSIGNGSMIMLTTREDPPIDLHRLRADGDLLEFRADELAMDAATIEAVLARVGPARSPSELDRIVDRTEGWPAGVGLVGLKPPTTATGEPGVDRVGQREVSDYFLHEVISEMSPETRDFICRIAVLNSFSAPLCDFALDRCDSADMLRGLECSNVFLIPLDEGHLWFRYHHLFSEFLAHPRYAVDDAGRAAILRRAAKWHRRHGRSDDAIVAAQASGDVQLFGAIALQMAEAYIVSGRFESFRIVLERTSDLDITNNTNLSIVAAHLYSRLGDTARSRMFLDAAERADDLDAPASNQSANLRSMVLVTRNSVWQASVSAMLADGEHIIELERSASSRSLLSGLRIAGSALLHQGRTTEAIRYLALGDLNARARADLPHGHMLVASYLILALLDDRQFDVAAVRFDDLIADVGPFRRIFPLDSLASYVAEAHVALTRGDAAAARFALAVAHRSLEEIPVFPVMGADLAVRCAELAIELRDSELANTFAVLGRRALADVTDPGQIAERLDAVRHTLSSALVALGRLTPAQRRVLDQLTTHRTLEEISEQLFVSRTTVKTHVRAVYRTLGVSTRREAVELLMSVTPTAAAVPAR